jgi:plastocyanin
MRLALLLTPLILTGASPPSATPMAAPVTFTLSNYRFDPSIILLQPGRPYRLHLVNTSTRGHNFVAPAFLAATGQKARRIEVEPGHSVDLAIVAPAAGNYPVKCTHFTHALSGMTGWVIVK